MFLHRYGFLIACQNYKNGIETLSSPQNDVRKIAALLENEYGFECNLCLDPDRAQLLLFLSNISAVVNSEKKETQVIIYFAGHGIALESDLGIKGYLIPADAGRDITDLPDQHLVNMDYLTEQMSKIHCQQILCVLDCCFAGSIRWSTETYRDLSLDEQSVKYRNQLDFYRKHYSAQVLTSTSHNQKALDRFGIRDDGDTNSPFARSFLRALSGDADKDSVGLSAVDDVKRYINRRLNEQYHFKQGAELFTLSNHDSGTFLFIEKTCNFESLPVLAFQNPYKSLNPYEFDDAGTYFGREETIVELQKKSLATDKIVVISGASGSGKSSLVKAGLLPALTKLKSDYAIVYPGTDPLQNLAAATNQQGVKILVIDQMEQLITRAKMINQEAIDSFLEALEKLSLKIICTIRIDFESQIFPNNKNGHSKFDVYRIAPLERDNLLSVILRPAVRVGRFFYPEKFVYEIITDFLSYPNSLPLLSMVLYEMFEKSKNNPYQEITLEDYEQIGRLRGVLNTKLDELNTRFSSPDRSNLLLNIISRMTSVRGAKLASRRISETDLVFSTSEKNELCAEVIETLTGDEFRLLIENADENYVEPVHDVVVQSWGIRKEWIEHLGNDRLLLREELSNAVDEYHRQNCNAKYLWHNDPNLLLIGDQPKKGWKRYLWDWQGFEKSFGECLSWSNKIEGEFLSKSFKRRKLKGH